MATALLILAVALVVGGSALHVLARNGSQQSLAGVLLVGGIGFAMIGALFKLVGI